MICSFLITGVQLCFMLIVSISYADDSFIYLMENIRPRSKRLALHPSQWKLHLWPDGIVPYHIASHYTKNEVAIIESAMKEFHDKTCIRFRRRTSTDKFVLHINKYWSLETCYSYIGRQTSYQFRTYNGTFETRMRLAPACLAHNAKGTVMHELMHIIGFYHEHQREDRDARIGGDSNHYNYRTLSRAKTFYMGAYDPYSIMHYNFPGIVHPRNKFTHSDISRINQLYNCYTPGLKKVFVQGGNEEFIKRRRI